MTSSARAAVWLAAAMALSIPALAIADGPTRGVVFVANAVVLIAEA